MLLVLIREMPSSKSFKLDEKATRGGKVPAQKSNHAVFSFTCTWNGQHNMRIWILKAQIE